MDEYEKLSDLIDQACDMAERHVRMLSGQAVPDKDALLASIARAAHEERLGGAVAAVSGITPATERDRDLLAVVDACFSACQATAAANARILITRAVAGLDVPDDPSCRDAKLAARCTDAVLRAAPLQVSREAVAAILEGVMSKCRDERLRPRHDAADKALRLIRMAT